MGVIGQLFFPILLGYRDKCIQCNRKVQQFSRHLVCFACNCATHLNCIPLVKRFDSIFANRESNRWLCIGCVESIFPFNHSRDEEDFLRDISECWKSSVKQWTAQIPISLARLLEERPFNPLELNDNPSSPMYNIDPDIQVLNDLYVSNSMLRSNYHS